MENTLLLAEKDDTAFYIRFLEDVFPCMEDCRYEKRMSLVLEALSSAVEQLPQAQPRDRALILDYHAAMEKDPLRAIKLEKDAVDALGAVTAGTAHLAANLHTNLGGLYRETQQLEPARQHLEQGLFLLEQHGLIYSYDIIPQFTNYAAFLTDVGEADKALSALRKLLAMIQKYNSDQCSDYAAVLETMGRICLVKGEVSEAIEFFKQAAAIYETVWEEDPEWIAAKKQGLFALFPQAGIRYAKQLERIRKKRA